MEKYATYQGKTGRILASYSERLPIKDQLALRREWHRTAPDARWLRFDEVGGEIWAEGILVIGPFFADSKLLVQFSPDDLAELHF